MPEHFRYDVFISYGSKDHSTASRLAERLNAEGLNVWLDKWEIKPEDLPGPIVDKGLEQSRTLVLVMSGNVSESEWVTFERQILLFSDPSEQQRRLIPLRLDDAEIKNQLKQFAYIDWRSPKKYERLIAACHPPKRERVEVAKRGQLTRQIPSL